MKKRLLENQKNLFLVVLFAVECVMAFVYYGCFFPVEHDGSNLPYGIAEAYLWRYGSIGYNKVLIIAAMALVVLVAAHIFFSMMCMDRVSKEVQRGCMYLQILLGVLMIPTFAGRYQLASWNLYLVVVSLVACGLLIAGKMEWLLVPMIILAMRISQEYLLLYAAPVLVLLFYKYRHKREEKKYLWLLIVNLAVMVLMFIWQEMRGNHFIQPDWELKITNLAEMLLFMILFSPYLYCGWLFLRKVKSKEKDSFIVLLGCIWILPEMIVNNKYGEYIFAIAFYYLVTFVSLIAMGNQVIMEGWQSVEQDIKKYLPAKELLIAYPLLFMPFGDIHVTESIQKIVGKAIQMIQ